MRIGIDARLYGPRHGGIGRYTQQLIKHLKLFDTKNEYVLFMSKEGYRQFRSRDRRFRIVLAPYRLYTVAEQIFFPLQIWSGRVHVMHFPHFSVPFLYRGNFIVTIHDLILHHFSDERMTTHALWAYRLKLWGYHKIMRHAVAHSRAILTPTEFTKKDIATHYRNVLTKTHVTYLGCSIVPRKLPFAMKTIGYDPRIRPYILYVGHMYPHKNIEKLIDGFHILRSKLRTDAQLILVGKKDFFSSRLQKETHAVYPHETDCNVRFLGYIPDTELSLLYQGATLYVFPSLYEGFGLPPLEAMAHGVPVAAARTSCLPEVLGDAALYFDPKDSYDIARALHKGLKDADLRFEYVQRGYACLEKYSWESCTAKTLLVYEKAVGSRDSFRNILSF